MQNANTNPTKIDRFLLVKSFLYQKYNIYLLHKHILIPHIYFRFNVPSIYESPLRNVVYKKSRIFSSFSEQIHTFFFILCLKNRTILL